MTSTKAFILSILFVSLIFAIAACEQSKGDEVVIPTRVSLTTPTHTPTITPSPTETPLPTDTPSITPSPTETIVPSATIKPSATFSPTPSPTTASNTIPTVTPAPPLDTQIFSSLATQIDSLGMMETIQRMVSFENRFTNSAVDASTGIYAARDYLTGRLNQLSAQCGNTANVYENSFDVTYEGQDSTQANLVLEVVGTAPSDTVLVVGAHYDTMSKEPRLSDEFTYQPGADDNGSGVAAVLELARLLCISPPQKTVVLVLFAAEEIRTADASGRVGSRYFVNSMTWQRDWDIEAMLNLDTIGSATDVRGAIIDNLARVYSAPPVDGASRSLARHIQAAAYVQLPDFQIMVENTEDRQNRWGDHMSFTRAGYPAARLFEGSEDVDRQDSRQDLVNDIDPNYLSNNVQVALAFLLARSDGFPAPSNIITTGTTVFWDQVPDASGYLLATRKPNDSNYTFQIIPFYESIAQVERDTVFALGTIGSNGILGMLSEEYYIDP